MEAGPGRGTFSVRSPCKKGARRRDTLRKKGAVRGQIGRELVSPHPPQQVSHFIFTTTL